MNTSILREILAPSKNLLLCPITSLSSAARCIVGPCPWHAHRSQLVNIVCLEGRKKFRSNITGTIRSLNYLSTVWPNNTRLFGGTEGEGHSKWKIKEERYWRFFLCFSHDCVCACTVFLSRNKEKLLSECSPKATRYIAALILLLLLLLMMVIFTDL